MARTQSEVKYPKRELLDNAEAVFGVKPEVIAGALHGNDAEMLTVSEVKKAIEEFLKRKVS